VNGLKPSGEAFQRSISFFQNENIKTQELPCPFFDRIIDTFCILLTDKGLKILFCVKILKK